MLLYWNYVFAPKLWSFNSIGFSHSDISGLKPACGSPKLFAACHVLLRHVSPRHSPVALLLFNYKHCSFFKIGLLLHAWFYCISSSYILRFFLYCRFFTRFLFLVNLLCLKSHSTNCQRTKIVFLRRLSRPTFMVGPDGLEPSTPRLSSVCSNQLSYEPSWWSRTGSNR